ncbi:response regulator [Terasakiella sp. SH-1]|uniref:response regulator n=1 Tax=Terasakiella sp. SH-1 TaxID=2560057 RepID=UPI001073CA5C|nr:response regulator [Terasakiella sp. SH-1]
MNDVTGNTQNNTTGLNFRDLSFLIVDKDRRAATVLRTILRNFYARDIDFAPSTIQAYAHLHEKHTDIILVESDLGGDDTGFDLVKKIRASSFEDYQHIPIIMMTADASEKNVSMARDIGVNEFMVKPVSPKETFDHISSVITHPRPFIEVENYAGPDRRRKKEFFEQERRKENLQKQAREESETLAETQVETQG